MYYIESVRTDPRWNLAMEQYVFDELDRKESYFLLWQNDNTIVVGKYQNTVGEINNDFVREHGITVVRRLSGGGAVYHDLGNLNFTFITDASAMERINFKMFCLPIVETLRSFGVTAEISGRNDITVEGKKFSGNAQYLKDGRVMHHGTILFSSDLSIVGQALRVDQAKIASKGVKSVASRVTNLCDCLPAGVTLQDFKARLLSHLGESEAIRPLTLTEEDETRIDAIRRERYDTWEWNYGRSPAYTDTHRARFEGCGQVEVSFSVKEGRIGEIQFFGDFFENGDVNRLAERLRGTPVRRDEILSRLADFDPGAQIRGLTAGMLAELIAP